MRTLILLALVLVSAAAAELPFKQPAAFACDIAFSGSKADEKGNGRMIVGGADKQRMEITSKEGAMVVIVRKDLKQMIMLMTEQKMAMTMPLNEKMMQVKDPTQDPKASFTKSGSETINGVACDRYEWVSGNGDKGTAWIDSKQAVLVRAKPADGKGQLDCSNYKIGAQKADLFEVPADYQTMGGMGGMGGQ